MQASYILIKYFCISCSTQETQWNTGLLSFLTFLHINIMQWYHFRFENGSILNFSKFYCIVLTSWKPEEKRRAARSKCRCGWEDNIKLHTKGTVWSCGLNSSSSRQSPVMVYYEHYAIKGAKFLTKSQYNKEYCIPWKSGKVKMFGNETNKPNCMLKTLGAD